MSRGLGSACALSAAVSALAFAGVASAAPRTGDWEASGGHGAVGTFEVTTVSGSSHSHERYRAIEDLVVQAPIGCKNAFSTPLPIDVEVISGVARLSKSGSFALGAIKKRGGTAVTGTLHHGALELTYRHVSRSVNAYEGGAEVCDTGKVHLTAKPGHRKALKDGVWEGQTAEQEPVELNIVAGGRALLSPTGLGPGGTKFYAFEIAGNSSTDSCGYQISYPMFLSPDGSFSNGATRLGDEADVSASFSGPHSVSGEFSNLEESCAQQSWSASWDLPKP
jgi:hypothetical protein